jgi:hypothetical protein
MAYIGNTAASRFVSNRAASVYSGDGSTVAFTLEQVVTQDEDVLVSVDGVVQEPSVAYAVSSGTTLTFTAAPSNNAGNNIFVYYLASQAGTIGHPSTQGLTATTGTFSGAITGGGVLTTGGNVVIPNAGNIGSVGDTDAMSIASDGVVTFTQTPVNAGDTSHFVKLSIVTTAGATSVDFDSSLITDSYMTYRIIASNSRPITNNVTPELLLSIDNGSSLDLNVRGSKFHQRLFTAQTGNEYYGASGSVHQMGNNVSNTASVLSAFDVTVYNTRSTTGIKYVQSQFFSNLNGDADGYLWQGASRVNTTSAINFLRLKYSSGNIAGTFTLYGIVA